MVFSSSAFALTDEQYKLFMNESLKFKLAETQLNNVWGMIKSTTPKDKFSLIQKEQREWIGKRDENARNIQAKSNGILSLADSYAEETTRRTKHLQETYLFANSGKPSIKGTTDTNVKAPVEGKPFTFTGEVWTIQQTGFNSVVFDIFNNSKENRYSVRFQDSDLERTTSEFRNCMGSGDGRLIEFTAIVEKVVDKGLFTVALDKSSICKRLN
jgi:Uncharacterized protein conserved in bacteria